MVEDWVIGWKGRQLVVGSETSGSGRGSFGTGTDPRRTCSFCDGGVVAGTLSPDFDSSERDGGVWWRWG